MAGNPTAYNREIGASLTYQPGQGWYSAQSGSVYGQPIEVPPPPGGYSASGRLETAGGNPTAYNQGTGESITFYPDRGWVSSQTGQPVTTPHVPSPPPGFVVVGQQETAAGEASAYNRDSGQYLMFDGRRWVPTGRGR